MPGEDGNVAAVHLGRGVRVRLSRSALRCVACVVCAECRISRHSVGVDLADTAAPLTAFEATLSSDREKRTSGP